ncbi:ABC transporter ATP-binding protein [Corallincola spongiicola]|uniref:ABC transporter ATP-binding protein n=1 Tax=Corallincola spongiicola TaxID=2520508 RepID=A0ABY1WPH8_9GAMM|nr:ABC transporter ATP-binding protein [Corallincola spongiicola]TAA45975.1 ABC transporter ATP-binding protein [Corallincola spongiicola]
MPCSATPSAPVSGYVAASTAQPVQLDLQQLSVNYGDVSAVKSVNLQLHQGEIGCLLGPSGCGKSTLLRTIAGFETLQQGRITMHGVQLAEPQHQLPPEQRKIGMVFQDIALFPHLTVAQNIAFGLRQQTKRQIQQRVSELLKLIGLPDTEERYPSSLSGGQQQRVALARALAPKPDLLLLDEPFSGLDATLKETLVPEVRQILQKENITALMVTHDQMEAFAIADRVAIMQQGKIHQFDTPYEIYHAPKTRFVADFIGQGHFVPALAFNHCEIKTNFVNASLQFEHGFDVETPIELLIRPDDLEHDDDSELTGTIISKQFRGTSFQYEIELPCGERALCIASSHHDHGVGEAIGIRLDLQHVIFFVKDNPGED